LEDDDVVDNVSALMEDELISRQILQVKEMGRTFICSTGAHCFNIENKLRMHRQSMLLNQGTPRLPSLYRQKYKDFIVRPDRRWRPPIVEAHANAKDTRMHIITVAPIGTGKTLYMEQFLFIPNSLLLGTFIQPVFKGSMTEPGWIGTLQLDRGRQHIEYGVAYKHSMSIIGIDEFHAIAERMKSSHSNTLEDQLLMSLDHGHVAKDLAAGGLEYTTFATLHGGIQPTRISMSSGMARRLCFINHIPTSDDYKAYTKKYFQAWGAQASYGRLQTIRNSVDRKINQLKFVTEIDLGMEELKDWVENTGIPHFEIDLLFRLALGWTIMSTDISEGIFIKQTDIVKDLMVKQIKWRDEVKFGSELSQIDQLLKDNGGSMNRTMLIRHLVKMQSVQPNHVKDLLQQMTRLGMIADRAYTIHRRVDEDEQGDEVNE
jgi:hypothetical protein